MSLIRCTVLCCFGNLKCFLYSTVTSCSFLQKDTVDQSETSHLAALLILLDVSLKTRKSIFCHAGHPRKGTNTNICLEAMNIGVIWR
jgi:hypothetical protein